MTGFGQVVMGQIRCLLVLEFKMRCQKFPNILCTLSPSAPAPVSCFYRKYWCENWNKCRFYRKRGIFQIPGFPLFHCQCLFWRLAASWQYSSCKVPLFHLTEIWAKDMCCGDYDTSRNTSRKSIVLNLTAHSVLSKCALVFLLYMCIRQGSVTLLEQLHLSQFSDVY